MKTLRITTCSCCGADLTKPQFFNGKVYGYTCINKVAGKGFVKNKMVMVEVDLLKIVIPENSARISKLIVDIEGMRVNMGIFYAVSSEVLAGDIKTLGSTGSTIRMVEGRVYISKKEYVRIVKDNQ